MASAPCALLELREAERRPLVEGAGERCVHTRLPALAPFPRIAPVELLRQQARRGEAFPQVRLGHDVDVRLREVGGEEAALGRGLPLAGGGGGRREGRVAGATGEEGGDGERDALRSRTSSVAGHVAAFSWRQPAAPRVSGACRDPRRSAAAGIRVPKNGRPASAQSGARKKPARAGFFPPWRAARVTCRGSTSSASRSRRPTT